MFDALRNLFAPRAPAAPPPIAPRPTHPQTLRGFYATMRLPEFWAGALGSRTHGKSLGPLVERAGMSERTTLDLSDDQRRINTEQLAVIEAINKTTALAPDVQIDILPEFRRWHADGGRRMQTELRLIEPEFDPDAQLDIPRPRR